VYDPCVKTHSYLLLKLNGVLVKSTDGGGLEDGGRRLSVKSCFSRKNLMERLLTNGETYALVIIREPKGSFIGEKQSIIKELRKGGYFNFIGVLMDKCFDIESANARKHGANSVLVHHTGTLTDELGRILSNLCKRVTKKLVG